MNRPPSDHPVFAECLRLVIALCALFLLSCSRLPEARQEPVPVPTGLIPPEWKPSLEQVQEELEDNLAARPNQSQQALNKANQNLADIADAQLFITYTLLLQQLDDKGRNALYTEQHAWLAQRQAAAHAAVLSKGGSLESLEY